MNNAEIEIEIETKYCRRSLRLLETVVEDKWTSEHLCNSKPEVLKVRRKSNTDQHRKNNDTVLETHEE